MGTSVYENEQALRSLHMTQWLKSDNIEVTAVYF